MTELQQNETRTPPRVGWGSWTARVTMGVLLFETASGLFITFGRFGPATQSSVILHTLAGVITLLPVMAYGLLHWLDYRHYRMSHVVLLGYVGVFMLFICMLSGIILTWQGIMDVKTSPFWRQVHLLSTFAIIATVLPHLLVLISRLAQRTEPSRAAGYLGWSLGMTMVGVIFIAVAANAWTPPPYINEFPDDYTYPYGEDRPFAPSLAHTDTGGAFDPRSLAGSDSCGTSGCHSQILAEWSPSAHRYAAMDPLFQGIQNVMAKQNGPESTRYCGGCHDPISLFSGAKNVFAEDLTGLQGFNEGISCLVCHAVRETDLQGNANYVMTQPAEYLWQWDTEGAARVARDFLIRTYPATHQKLSKRMFKAPEYCAACHKQFIDEEVNQVGWVQLQNQYDNWAASKWHVKDDPTRTIECRECHMPLIDDSNDPASGDAADYNRSPEDGKHRSHRFIAANALAPALLKLDGWEEHVRLTQEWLAGEREIPEIADKWASGPIVTMQLAVPDTIPAGEELPVQVIFTSNKVGHDFPTGPLDIIQSWLELQVKDDAGNVLFTMGTRDEAHFIEPGTFMFKAEPIDQYGNTIDRHNLWEMVGVRFRRALFPGYADAVDFSIDCSAALSRDEAAESLDFSDSITLNPSQDPGNYHITAILQYRKVDQFLLNYLLGEESGVFAPVMELTRAVATVKVTSR